MALQRRMRSTAAFCSGVYSRSCRPWLCSRNLADEVDGEGFTPDEEDIRMATRKKINLRSEGYLVPMCRTGVMAEKRRLRVDWLLVGWCDGENKLALSTSREKGLA